MPDSAAHPPGAAADAPAKPAMKRQWLLIILALTFLFILMPFLFWQATWFGEPLTDAQLQKSLVNTQQPREIQHALSQIADRILSPSPAVRDSARPFYPQVIRIAATGDDDLRLTAAWVMGQDNTFPEFRPALVALLKDGNPMVRRNAALALVRFADSSGLPEIRAIFQPSAVAAPRAGKVTARLQPGDTVNPGTLLGRITTELGRVASGSEQIEVRSQVPGTLKSWLVTNGESVSAGQSIALIDASSPEVWEALRALYLIGQPQDLPAVDQLAQPGNGVPEAVRQQAVRTAGAIRDRAATGKALAPPAAPSQLGATH
jgi:hypothetical protein